MAFSCFFGYALVLLFLAAFLLPCAFLLLKAYRGGDSESDSESSEEAEALVNDNDAFLNPTIPVITTTLSFVNKYKCQCFPVERPDGRSSSGNEIGVSRRGRRKRRGRA